MKTNRFRIVFQKLREIAEEEKKGTREDKITIISEANTTEMEEIAELRRLVIETTEVDQHLFTTT